MESTQRKNLIYSVIILFSVSVTVYLWTKDSGLGTEGTGSEIAHESLENGYLEDEMSVDSEVGRSGGMTGRGNSGIEDADAMELAAKKTRDAMRKSNLSYIYSRLISYYDDHGDAYPVSGDRMIKLNDKETAAYKELVPGYVNEDFMKDPNDPDSYFGYKSPDGKDFELTAVLENSEDKDCIKTGSLCIYKYNSEGVVSGR